MSGRDPSSKRDSDFADAIARLVPDAGSVAPVAAAPHLVRVDVTSGDVLVRRWEEDATRARVETIATALDAAIHAGADALRTWDAVPGENRVRSIVVNGRLFTRGRWIEGRPLARYGGYRNPDGETIDVPLPPSAAADPVLAAAVRQIALVHRASRDVTTADTGSGTLRALHEAAKSGYARQRRIIGDRAATFPEIRRWLRCANRVLPVAGPRVLEATGSVDDAPVVMHGDLWPIHLLVADRGGEPSLAGIAGWSDGRRGSPLIDLAHLATHMAPWSAANAETLLGAYTEHAPLRPEERRLLPVVAALDLIGRVARLLHAAFVDDRMIDHDAQGVLRSGLKTMLVSLETLTNVLAPETEWSKRQAHLARGGPRGAGRRQERGAPRPGAGRPRRGSGSGRRKAR